MELENKEVGHGLNIPGSFVGGDYTCKKTVRMNVFMEGIYLYMPRPQLANNGRGHSISAPFSCYMSLLPK